MANRKGGAGKTSVTLQLASALALWGLKVRACDADDQFASLTLWTPPQAQQFDTLLEVFKDEITLSEATYETGIDRLSIIPSFTSLALVNMGQPPVGPDALLDHYEKDDYPADVELIDSAPNLGLLALNALYAATHIVLTCNTSTLDEAALTEVLPHITKIQKRFNPDLELSAIILPMDSPNTMLSREIRGRLQEAHPDALIASAPKSIRMGEAPSYHQHIYGLDPSSGVAIAYWQFSARMVDRLGLTWEVAPEDIAQEDDAA